MPTNALFHSFRVLSETGLLALALLCSCAPQSTTVEKALVTECVLPKDQEGTLSARWPVTGVAKTGIPVAFRQAQFSTDEITAIGKAADSWNSYFKQAMKLPIMVNYVDTSKPRISATDLAADICSVSMSEGGQFTAPIVIYKQAKWTHADLPNAIAITKFCTLKDARVPTMYAASIELNYENYFGANKKNPDLESILLHEFGHLLGVNHSCGDGSLSGIPDCNSPTIDPGYLQASMFPSFKFNGLLGEKRRSLADNDEGRSMCLYSEFRDTSKN